MVHQSKLNSNHFRPLYFRYLPGDCALSVFEIECQQQLIIIYKDGIDKGINQHLAVLLLGHIKLAELVQPELHEVGWNFGLKN